MTTRSPALDATTAYLLYDDHFLYVGFKAAQSPGSIAASQTTNDVGFGIDDFVGIGIDTSGAGSQAYYFETTPRGVRYQSAVENVRYRPRWQAAATIGPSGWSAVLVIPLDVLKIRSGKAQTWRLQFVRALARKGEHYVWAYDGLMSDAPAGQWPTFADTRWWASATNVTTAAGGGRGGARGRADVFGLASIGEDRNLFQQANGQFLPMTVRHFRPRRQLFVDADDELRRHARSGFLQRRDRPADDRARKSSSGNSSSTGRSSRKGPTSSTPTPAPARPRRRSRPLPTTYFYSPEVGPFDRGAKVEGTFGDQSLGVLSFRGFDRNHRQHVRRSGVRIRTRPARRNVSVLERRRAWRITALPETTRRSKPAWKGATSRAGWCGSSTTRSKPAVGYRRDTPISSEACFVDVHKPNYEVYAGYFDVSPNYDPIDGFTVNSDIRGPQAS